MNQHSVFGPAPSRIEFPDAPTALKYLEDYSRPLGFCVVIRGSNKRPATGEHFQTFYRCDRGARYVDQTRESANPRKKRNEAGVLPGTGTRKTNCPFQLRLQKDVDGVWRLYCNRLYHNHGPSVNSSAHPKLRARDLESTRTRSRDRTMRASRRVR
jgi:hypothetical protein